MTGHINLHCYMYICACSAVVSVLLVLCSVAALRSLVRFGLVPIVNCAFVA